MFFISYKNKFSVKKKYRKIYLKNKKLKTNFTLQNRSYITHSNKNLIAIIIDSFIIIPPLLKF